MYDLISTFFARYVSELSNDVDSLLYVTYFKTSWLYFKQFKDKLFAVTIPTGKIPSAESDDSLLIEKSIMSEDISLIHLADNSITPIMFVELGLVAFKVIDLISCGSE